MLEKLRIVFMGTPEFAVCSLEKLVQSAHQVVAVVTVADKPAGRGQKMQESAVKQFAVQHSIPVLQPLKLKDESFLHTLREMNADLFVVVAFRMLPEVVWKMPRLGSINLHASLLPQYRGAAPINHAIINGEIETGVTTFFLQQEIDTGNIIQSKIISIGENETTGELHDRMKVLGADVLLQTVNLIAEGNAPSKPQNTFDSAQLKEAPKLTRESCKIDWDQPVAKVHNHIRGLSPYPAAWIIFEGKNLKVFRGKKIPGMVDVIPGEYQIVGQTSLRFACNDGWYEITDLQIEGKKRMTTVELLRGRR
jgi:methionyl-tRNA formyltransferase